MKTIILDFDGTLHSQLNGWKQIWIKLGYNTHQYSYYYQLYDAFQDGELSHEEWYALTAKAFRKKALSKKVVDAIARNTVLLDGSSDFLQYLKKNNFKVFIICGAINEIISCALGENIKYIDKISSIKLIYDKHNVFKNIDLSSFCREGKRFFAKEYCNNTNTPTKDVIFIGDCFRNDYSPFKTICINPRKINRLVNTDNDHLVTHTSNLTDLIPLIEQLSTNTELDENSLI